MDAPTREQLQAQERTLAQERRQQEGFVHFCEDVPMHSREAREELVSNERRKLREIEERLIAVRETLRDMPADLPPAAPTPS